MKSTQVDSSTAGGGEGFSLRVFQDMSKLERMKRSYRLAVFIYFFCALNRLKWIHFADLFRSHSQILTMPTRRLLCERQQQRRRRKSGVAAHQECHRSSSIFLSKRLFCSAPIGASSPLSPSSPLPPPHRPARLVRPFVTLL